MLYHNPLTAHKIIEDNLRLRVHGRVFITNKRYGNIKNLAESTNSWDWVIVFETKMYTFPDTLLDISAISHSFNRPQDYRGQLTFKSARTCIESRAYVFSIYTYHFIIQENAYHKSHCI